MITQRRLKQVLSFDEEAGVFFWKEARSGIRVGMVAGSLHPKGYVMIKIDGRRYRRSRLVILWKTGHWPKYQVDHHDRDRSNDRRKNLRSATNKQNGWNQGKPRNNTSGFKGVSFHKATGKYQASIRKNGLKTYLGVHATPELAHIAYRRAAAKMFGRFAERWTA